MSLKKIRRKKGITQEELGKKTLLTRHFIGLLESKKRNASKETASKIAYILKVNISSIFLPTNDSKKSFISK